MYYEYSLFRVVHRARRERYLREKKNGRARSWGREAMQTLLDCLGVSCIQTEPPALPDKTCIKVQKMHPPNIFWPMLAILGKTF